MLDFCTSQEIFHPSRKNPNGCPIAATFYVSHEWTDYGLVQSLYSGGCSWIPRRHPVSLIEKHVTRSGKKYSDILIEKYVSWCLTRNHGAIPQTVTRSPRIQSHTASANRFLIENEFESRLKIPSFSSAKRSGWRRWPVKGKYFQVWHLFIFSKIYWTESCGGKMIRFVFQGLLGSSWKMFGG